MKKKNPSKLVDIREVVQRLGRDVPELDKDGWGMMRCVSPEHADDKPSLSVNFNSGGWKCFGGCGSGNIVELVMLAKRKLSKEDARRWLRGISETSLVKVETAAGGEVGATSTPPASTPDDDREYTLTEIEEKLAQAQKVTREYAKADEWFRRQMGIGLPTAERFGLAYYKGTWGDVFRGLRVLFPIRDADGKLLTMLGYAREKEPKVLPLRKNLGSHLYPLDQLPKDAETIIIVEGIRDCVIAYENGLVAITGTAGAGCWKSEWTGILRDRGVKRVIILFDHDPAGFRGAEKVASLVSLVGIEVSIAHWPEGSPPKFDLADWFASGRTADELRTEVLDKAKPYVAEIVRRSSHVVKYGDLSIFVPDSRKPRSAMANELANTLSETGVFYTRGEDIWFVSGEYAFPILDKCRLAGAVDGLVEFADLEFDDSLIESDGKPAIMATYYDPQIELFKRVLYSPYQRGKFPPLTLHTQNPQFDKTFRLIPPGYHRETGIYYAGPAITPADGLTHIETMCREFAWKDKTTDTTHFVSALLTTMLAVHFVGDHPAYVLYGNQCGLGKTLLAKLCARIVTGRTAPSITYTSNDEEFEKRIATEVDKGGSVILIDNVKTPVIESDVLERCL
ncbi:MAG: toprim domain-containing protein, partial [Planctomycetota bacterium]